MIKYINVCFLVTLSFTLSSQNNQFINYTTRNGLISNNVYIIKQDSKGFVWASTDKGVVRYDGKKFKLFTTENGLASNDNFSMLIDSKDNIWLYSFKAISKIEPSGRVKNILDTKSYFGQFLINDNDEIYCSIGKFNLYYFIVNDKVFDINYSYKFEKTYNTGYAVFWQNSLIHYIFDVKNDTSVGILVLDKSKMQMVVERDKYNAGINLPFKSPHITEYYRFDDSTFAAFSERHYRFLVNGQLQPVKEYPESMNKISNGNIHHFKNEFYITLSNGIFKYDVINRNWLLIKRVDNITGLLFDTENNMWIATLGEGVFKYNNHSAEKGLYSNELLMTDKVLKINGYKLDNIWVGTSKNQIFDLKTKNKYRNVDLKDLRFIVGDSIDVYYGGSNKVYRNRNYFAQYGFKALSLYRDSIIISSTFGINFLHKNHLNNLTSNKRPRLDIRGRFYSVLLLSNLFYSGNQQGLFWGRPKKDELFPICLEDSDESVSVNGILEAADKNIWVSTEGKGVYVLKDKKVIRHFEKELLDGNIHSMKIDEQDQVWISTRKGINKIEKGPRDYRVKKYTSYHGLPSDYVYDTYCYQDILYAATDEGLVKIDMNELDKLNFGMPPPVYIMNATVQSKSTLLKLNTDTIGEFSSQQNTISFEYTGISYKSNGNISFEYRLLPTINKWVATTNDNITFNNLSAGDYSFEVVAINAIGIRSAKPAVYRFRIEKHFTATIWFITLCIGLIIGLIGWAIYKYLKYEKLKLGEKSQNEKVIAELTLKSLQAQLNPHFIFNSLNAIQQFINVENRKEANEYLARFARLMRLYLGGSENQFISLEQEMEVIKLYCQLEHLRFSDRFRYEINMDDSIDLKNVEVPAMLLQPHVENAIRHGLIPCDSDNNLLQINIYSVNDGVICAIKDNGIGRSQSFINKQGKENRHKSLGNKISKERLDAIRSLHLAYITEEISDVIVDGEIRGTCVEIYIRKKD